MGVQCAVPHCKNASLRHANNENKKRISYHMFPKDEFYKEEWISKCRRSTPYNYDNAYMCSEHFANDDFLREIKSESPHLPVKRKLKPDAIPSRLLGNPFIIEKSPKDKGRKRRYEMRKRNPMNVIESDSDERNTATLTNPPEVISPPPKEVKVEVTSAAKKLKTEDDDIDTEENLQKILNIVLERIHCLEQELEGLTHIMGDIKGRIEKIQSRY
ncbi:THAP domain-containing protein 2-like isoform X2 [Belonocnema kinseyi]|nr:THAP domain-containing protein 2-like isoform X2 [Belonocnema kinseyi]